MRRAVILVFCFLVIACSKALRINFINNSGTALEVCRLAEAVKKCISLAPDENGALIWGDGGFEINQAGRVLRYQASLPQPLEIYKPSQDEFVTVVIPPNLKILVAHNKQLPNQVSEQEQPNGYPLEPHP